MLEPKLFRAFALFELKQNTLLYIERDADRLVFEFEGEHFEVKIKSLATKGQIVPKDIKPKVLTFKDIYNNQNKD